MPADRKKVACPWPAGRRAAAPARCLQWGPGGRGAHAFGKIGARHARLLPDALDQRWPIEVEGGDATAHRALIASQKSTPYELNLGWAVDLAKERFIGQSALKAEAARVVPVLKDYQQWLEKNLLPRATGEWRLGAQKFAQKLDYTLNAGLSADDVLRAAESEFTRVHQELYVISRQLWSRYFPTAALPVADEAGRRTTIARVISAVSKEHGKPEELVTDARATVDRIKTFIREKDILRLPEPDRCQVIEMPEFQRGNSLAYMNGAPPLDPDAPSFYAISPPAKDWDPKRTQSLLEEYNRHMLQILTIHEAYPGHYVQLEYSSRAPSYLRRVLQSGVMIEGWAVYTEQMMLDQGYGGGDLALRLNQLKFYLRAVCNAMLDHKLHAQTMADADAIRLMVDGAFQSEEEARAKLIRAKQTSTQLSTYFVGRMAHVRLREEMQRTLGDKFSLGRYHEAVLSHGSIPMKYLAELVRANPGAATSK